jgi:23S rRNA (guanosine2251-2'-O)-methyltransferase
MAEAIVGFHAIEELLKKGERKGTLYLSGRQGRLSELLEQARKGGYTVRMVPERELEGYLQQADADHRGALFLAEGRRSSIRDLQGYLRERDKPGALVLALDGITDPQNLGAILRSAEQFGTDLVILPARRSARVNPTVEKVSAGASNYVEIVTVPNLRRALGELKAAGYWVYGTDMSGEPLWSSDIRGKSVIVMGSEGKGLAELVRKECDQLLKIPTMGRIDSLNVSVAAGVVLYERARSVQAATE